MRTDQKFALKIFNNNKALATIIKHTKEEEFISDSFNKKAGDWDFSFPIGLDIGDYNMSADEDKAEILSDSYKLSDLKIGNYDIATAMTNIVKRHFGDREPTDIEYENIAKGVYLVDNLITEQLGKVEDPYKYLSDSLGGLEGHEITPLELLATFQWFVEAPVPEMIGILNAIKPNGSDLYKIYNIVQTVTQSSGDLVKGDVYDVNTMGKTFALKARSESFVYRDADLVGNYALYEYTALQRKYDTTGTEIPLNKTSLTILRYKDGKLDDYNKKSINGVCSPEIVINDKTITMTINYATGNIKIKVQEGALKDGDKMILQTEVNVKNLEKDRALTQPDIVDFYYPPSTMSIGTHADAFEERKVLNQLGLGIMPYSQKLNLEKVIAEFREQAYRLSAGTARIWHNPIDLSSYPNTSNNDIYQHITTEIEIMSTRMNIESGFSTGAYLVGGEALQIAISKGKSIQRITKIYNGIRPLGLLGGKFNSYLFPSFDEDNPKVDIDGKINANPTENVYSKILVLGTVNQAANSLVIGSVNKPFRNENVGIDKNSERYRMIEGEYMLRLNENPKCHYLAYYLLVKGL